MKGIWMQNLLKGKGEIPFLQNKKGLLFSTITLDKMLDEERRHDVFLLTDESGRSIRSYSSGEQRKALLSYQIQQNPDFLVLDNPFDCLDEDSVAQLKEELLSVAQAIPLIQVFKRHDDILPFITEVLVIEKEQLSERYAVVEYVQQREIGGDFYLNSSVPAAPKAFKNIPDVLVELRDVTVRYEDRVVVNGISWCVKKGEFWHLKGPNGSGKTTLLSMIYGDNPKAFGQELYLFGNKKGSGESVWEIKEKIGYFTPSMTALFDGNHSVEQMVISGLVDSVGLYVKPSDQQVNLAKKWLKLIGMLDKREARFCSLSQVDQRLVLIVRAMVKHPPLLILDEPSTGLDDDSALWMVALINKIARESQTAIIYVSHRKEIGLHPQYTFELKKSDVGSVGLAY